MKPGLQRYLVPAWPSLLGGIVAAFVAGLQPLRGLNLWAVWQLDSAFAFEQWLDGGGDEAMAAAFAGDPWLGAPIGWLSAMLVDGDELVLGVRFVSAILAGVTVAIAAEFARRMAGAPAALLAAMILLVTPRFMQAATLPGPTIWLVTMAFGGLLAVTDLARRDRAFVGAIVAVAGLAHAGIAGWLWCIPLAWVLFVDVEARPGRGRLSMRPASIFMLAAIPVGLALAVVISPWWSADAGERVPAMLEFWLTRGAEPWLHRSWRYGAERIPWLAPVAIVALTWHTWSLVAAALGCMGSLDTRGREARRAVVAALIAALVLPVVLRSPWHGGIDLLVLVAPAIAALGGAGIVMALTAISRPHARRAALALGVFLAAVSIADLARYRGATEAYTTGFAGGPEGRVALGFSRAPHPVVPVGWVDALLDDADAVSVAVLTNGWEMRPILAAMSRWHLVDGDVHVVDIGAADVAVVVWDDTLPELYDVAADAMRMRDDPDATGPVHTVRGVPVIEAWRLR